METHLRLVIDSRDGKKQADEVATSLNAVGDKAIKAESSLSKVKTALDSANRSLAAVNAANQATNTSLDKLVALTDRHIASTERQTAILSRLGKEMRDVGTATERTSNAKAQAAANTDRYTQSSSQLAVAIRLLGTAFIAMKVGEYIRESMEAHTRTEQLGIAIEVLGRNTGQSAASISKHVAAVQGLGFSLVAAREAAAKFIQTGLPMDQLAKLADLARNVTVITGGSSAAALERLTQGVTGGQSESLKNMGLPVNFEESYKKAAAALKIHTDQLTEAEKMQIRLNTTLEKGTVLSGAYAASVGTAAQMQEQARQLADDLREKVGQVFSDVLLAHVSGFVERLEGSNKAMTDLSNNGKLKAWGEEMTDVLAGLIDIIMGIGKAFQTTFAVGSLAASKAASQFTLSKVTAAMMFPVLGPLPLHVVNNLPTWMQNPQQRAEASASAAREDTFGSRIDSIWDQSMTPTADRIARQRRARAAQDLNRQYSNQDMESGPGVTPGATVREKSRAQIAAEAAAAKKAATFLAQLEERVRERELDVMGTFDGEYVGSSKTAIEGAKTRYQAKKAGVPESKVAGQIEEMAGYDRVKREREAYIKQWQEMQDTMEEYYKAEAAHMDEEDKALVSSQRAVTERIDLMDHEFEIRNKSATEQRYLNELYKIDIDLAKQKEGRDAKTQADLEKLAQTLRDRVTQGFNTAREASTKWEEGVGKAVRSYRERAEDMASAAEEATGRIFSTAEDKLTELLTKGKLDLRGFIDMVISEFTRLAVVRPMLAELAKLIDQITSGGGAAVWGTNPMTATGGGGGLMGLLGGGAGGIINMLMGSGGGGWAGGAVDSVLSGGFDVLPFLAKGGVMTPGGLKRYAGGGIQRGGNPAMAIYGEGSMNEAFIPLPDGQSVPVSLRGGAGGAKVVVNVYNNAAGTEARTEERSDGGVDVIIEQVEDRMGDRIRKGSGLAPVLESQYGLDRSRGSSR